MPDTLSQVRQAVQLETAPSSDFDLNPGIVLPAGRKLRPAGVLVALIDGQDGLDVVLTKRSSALKHHPGQIAFAGGKQDEGDKTVIDTALREAKEEIGLPTDLVEVIGTLPTHETVTSFLVTPVVAHISAPFQGIAEPGEVAEIFRAPLAHVGDVARYQIQGRRWRGQMRFYNAVPYGPYYIWGATARILRVLAERLAVV